MASKIPMRLIMTAATALSIFACSSEPPAIPAIRVAYSPHDHHAALFIAALSPEHFQENGGLYLREKIFREDYDLVEGGKVLARVSLESSEGGAQNIRKLCENQYDFVFGSFPEMVKAIDAGKGIKVAAPLMSGGTGLIVSRDMCARNWREFIALARGISKPLRIGYKTEGSVQQRSFEAALMREGIAAGKGIGSSSYPVMTVNLYGQENLIPALKSGLVDGFVEMQPVLAEAEYEGAGRLIAYIEDYESTGGKGYFPCCAIGAREDFVENNREAAEKFLSLALRANRYVSDNPRVAAPKVARWLEEPVEVEEKSLPSIIYCSDISEEWRRNTGAWLEVAVAQNELTGEVRRAYEKRKPFERILDLPLLEKAEK
jgi:NitT/TauT family transport system substrate-binding protein